VVIANRLPYIRFPYPKIHYRWIGAACFKENPVTWFTLSNDGKGKIYVACKLWVRIGVFAQMTRIYVRVNRWAKKGVLQTVFLRLLQMGIIKIKVNVVSLDSTCIKVHSDGMGALKKERLSLSAEPEVDGIPNFIWSSHLIEMG